MKIQSTEKDDGTIIQKGTDPVLEKLQKAYPNVVGYARDMGNIKDGKPTGEEAFTVLVGEKKAEAQLRKDEIIPKTYEGLMTDVMALGQVLGPRPLPGTKGSRHPDAAEALGLADYKKTYEVPPCAVSWGNTEITAGTGGGPLTVNGIRHLGTNTHVACESIRLDLSDQNRDCTQAGPYDGGVGVRGYTAKAIIAPEGQVAFNDFAIIRPVNGTELDPATLANRVIPRGMTTIAVGDRVWKEGRTTGFTIATVLSLNATVSVGYGSDGYVTHVACILVTDFSDGGDSGSWVYKKVSEGDEITDEDKFVVAYLFAGSDTHTVCHEIQNALSAVGAELYTEQEPSPSPTGVEVNFIVERTGSGDFRIYGKVYEVDNEGNSVPVEDGIMAVSQSNADGTIPNKTTPTDAEGLYGIGGLSYGHETIVSFSKEGFVNKSKNIGVIE